MYPTILRRTQICRIPSMLFEFRVEREKEKKDSSFYLIPIASLLLGRTGQRKRKRSASGINCRQGSSHLGRVGSGRAGGKAGGYQTFPHSNVSTFKHCNYFALPALAWAPLKEPSWNWVAKYFLSTEIFKLNEAGEFWKPFWSATVAKKYWVRSGLSGCCWTAGWWPKGTLQRRLVSWHFCFGSCSGRGRAKLPSSKTENC